MAKVVKKLSQEEQLKQDMLYQLAQLGGRAIGEDDLEFGDKFVVPRMYKDDINAAIEYLVKYRDMMEEETTFSRTFPYKPWDGACAVESSFYKYFGTKGVARASFFERPQMVSVPVGVNDVRQVMWGKINVPIFRGVMRLGSTQDRDGNMVFNVAVAAAKKYEGAVEGLFKIIRDELDTNSIYRGKAVDGGEMPAFLDLTNVSIENLVFNEVTLLQLEANIWTPIRMPQIVKKQGVSTKRTILLEGPWGTGKSEAGRVTAAICTEQGRTFIMCNPKDNNVFEVLDMAAMYQPATVFIEDIDVLASQGDADQVQQYLDKFDGLAAKGKDIMVVMTTNHKEKIHKGMLRPGRLDAVVHIGSLDRVATETLFKKLFNGNLGDVDWDQVYEAVQGDDPEGKITGKNTSFTPAFIVESAAKIKLYQTAREKGEPTGNYDTLDFLSAIDEMRAHHNLHSHAGEGVPTPTLDRAFTELVLKTIDDSVSFVDPGTEETAVLQRAGK